MMLVDAHYASAWCAPSIMVSWLAVFLTGLPVMARLAQRLPVGLIPEQLHVPSVRFDVVHHRSPHIPTVRHAPDAQRMCFKKSLAGFLPLTSIAATRCRSCLIRMKGLMPVAVLHTAWYQLRTTGMTAWYSASEWHVASPQLCHLPDGLPGQL